MKRYILQKSPAPPARQYGKPSMTGFENPYELRMVERPSPCGENEIYDNCPPIYPPLRCNVQEMLTVCGMNPEPGNPECEPGCRCADNYYLNASGDCITREECLLGVSPTTCNSKSPGYSECINGGCTKWRCTDYGYVCLVKGPCEVGCGCQDSYKRSSTGTCMPADPCPPSQDMSTEEMMTPRQKPIRRPYSQYSKSDMEGTLF
ncbi:mucin-6-like [Maniola jurtina]|uniref:mucin-6-like n=1 Tax=Maniola jurtina TaxID=191418 RepID=UPI001E68E26B|nr:mucin-6-like [Maniola jurtina]